MSDRNDPWRSFWHPVGWAHELDTTPISTVLLDERLVLWRDADGTTRCFTDVCPHRGTALSLGEVSDGCLVCPYHGWSFGDDGTCIDIPQLPSGTEIPGRARVTTHRCRERYGIIWVALDEPRAPIPTFPEWDDPDYRHVPCDSYTWDAGAPRMVENFTDFAHLGWLHDGLLGSRDDLIVPEHRVRRDGLELHYELTMAVPNTNAAFAVTDVTGDRGVQTNTYILTLPHTIWLRCTYHDTGTHRTLFFSAQPRTEGRSTGYCYQSRDFAHEEPDRAFSDFQSLLAEQDRPIVESQVPKELPLSLADELQMPFDRVAVGYRRGLQAVAAAYSDVDDSWIHRI